MDTQTCCQMAVRPVSVASLPTMAARMGKWAHTAKAAASAITIRQQRAITRPSGAHLSSSHIIACRHTTAPAMIHAPREPLMSGSRGAWIIAGAVVCLHAMMWLLDRCAPEGRVIALCCLIVMALAAAFAVWAHFPILAAM